LSSNLKKLAAFLADDNPRASDMIDDVVAMLKSAGQADAAKRVQGSITNFDYEEALTGLQEIAQAVGVDI
ncbi:MAG: hypothetical protein HQK96_02295, partial [Nitrospirae bacterium]|nr:hypothetical protein [Nitrospirota bacterium]